MVYFGKNKVQFVKKYNKFKTQKIGLSGLFNYRTYFNEENISRYVCMVCEDNNYEKKQLLQSTGLRGKKIRKNQKEVNCVKSGDN